jgi:hypothetical protein
MVMFTGASGKIICSMVKESSSTLMAELTRENSAEINDKDVEKYSIKIIRISKASGKITRNKAQARFFKMELLNMGTGVKIKE